MRNRVNIGKCIANYQIKEAEKVAFLVDEQERQNRNVVEAARLETETSFLYGGSPSFVFYSGKYVRFFYDVTEFLSSHQTYPIFVISDQDKHDIGLESDKSIPEKYTKICKDGRWNAYMKR